MNLGEFHTQVRLELNRGTAVDAVIPGYVRRAARWVERNYTFPYMERFITATIPAGDRCVVMPGRLKSIGFIRTAWVDADGRPRPHHYITRIDPRDVLGGGCGVPQGYWLDAADSIIFDRASDEDIPLEVQLIQYTEWPSTDSATHWLLSNAEDAMIAQTCVMIAPLLRDPDLKQAYENMRVEAFRTLTLADDEFRYQNSDLRMNYGKVGSDWP